MDGEEIYRNRLHDFLDSFVEHSLQKHDRDSVRAIIVSGEASASRSIELGEMAKNAVGSQSAKVLTDIDPSEVVAYGAAVWARRVQREPRRFMIDSTSNLDHDISHDEL
jgi:molecular chaperone DnaK (HSP70)